MKNLFQIRDMHEMQGGKKLPVYEIVVDMHFDGNGTWFPKFGKKELDTVRGLDRPTYYTTPGPERVWILTDTQYFFLRMFLFLLKDNPKYENHMGIQVRRIREIIEKRIYEDDDRQGIATLKNICKGLKRESSMAVTFGSLKTLDSSDVYIQHGVVVPTNDFVLHRPITIG
jgi:hypothetical protein